MLYRYDVGLSPIGKFDRRGPMGRRQVLVRGRLVNLIQPTYGDGPFHPNLKGQPQPKGALVAYPLRTAGLIWAYRIWRPLVRLFWPDHYKGTCTIYTAGPPGIILKRDI